MEISRAYSFARFDAIACKLTPSEIAMLASILVQLGDTLATIATQRTLCEEQSEEK